MQDQVTLATRHSTIPENPTQELELAAGPLLQAALAQTLADGIYLCRVNADDAFPEMVCSRGLPAKLVRSFEASTDLDWGFELRPELPHSVFGTTMTVRLAREEGLAGILTAVRLARNGFASQEEAVLRRLQAPLATLLAMAASREENARLKSELQKVAARLAGRKHIERAKGIIQSRNGWTEEEAYMHLRSLSRKTRKPMGEIARDLIVHSASG